MNKTTKQQIWLSIIWGIPMILIFFDVYNEQTKFKLPRMGGIINEFIYGFNSQPKLIAKKIEYIFADEKRKANMTLEALYGEPIEDQKLRGRIVTEGQESMEVLANVFGCILFYIFIPILFVLTNKIKNKV
jgi:hypothetical protein